MGLAPADGAALAGLLRALFGFASVLYSAVMSLFAVAVMLWWILPGGFGIGGRNQAKGRPLRENMGESVDPDALRQWMGAPGRRRLRPRIGRLSEGTGHR